MAVLELHPSMIHGIGVFSSVPLSQGFVIEVYGQWIEPGSEQDICTAYGDRYKFRHRGGLILPIGYAGMMNHSERPNFERCEFGERLYLRAMRNIFRGEELTHRYGEDAIVRF